MMKYVYQQEIPRMHSAALIAVTMQFGTAGDASLARRATVTVKQEDGHGLQQQATVSVKPKMAITIQ
jgi:hypothetical protein